VIASHIMQRASLVEYLHNFERGGGQWAYVERRGYRSIRWSYSQIAALSYQFARALEARRIQKGDRILIWGANSAGWVAAFLGCILRGVIVVPMDDVATPDFAQRVYRQVEARLWVCSKKHAADAAFGSVILLDELNSCVAEYSPTACSPVELGRNDVLEIVFTSGTTSEPKGVVLTHGNVLANVEPLETEVNQYLKYERLVHPIRFLNLLPLSHIFGQFLGIFLPQLMAGTVVFQESLNPSEIMRSIRRERVSVLVAVPRILQSLKEKVERDLLGRGQLEAFRQEFRAAEGKHFLRRWWTFRRVHRQFGWKFWALISGGAALDRIAEEFWGRLGFAVIQGYGLTETTSVISVNHPFKLGKGSVGKVLAGREIRLAEDGEILVRGGGVASGYWRGGQFEPASDDEGWYATGDVGELDSEGHLYFKGRKKDVIVTSAGMNVYPEDLEAALRRQPEIRDCVTVALDHGGNAEPCAVLILRHHGVDPEPVVQRANQSLAEYQQIRRWFVWPEEDFPRTSTQKPRMAEIQARVQADLEQVPRTPVSESPLRRMIAEITGHAPGSLRPEANLEDDLHLSSLERVELMSALEDRYQVDMSEARFSAVRTVDDLELLWGSDTVPKIAYHYPHWAQRWPARWIRLLAHYLLLRPAVFLLGWPRVEGRDNLNGVHGPVLVVCNHIHDVDVGFVLTALPARIRNRLATAAGGETMEALRTPPARRGFMGRVWDRLKWFAGVVLLNLFPLPRQAGFRQSFAHAGELVDRSCSVLVFPEGRHTTTGGLQPFRAGIGILARELAIPVIPMRIDGLFEIKQSGRWFAAPGRIRVRIGSPLTFPRDSDPDGIAEELHKIVEHLQGTD
jgi:long-chain acyl-CoA synthetase